MRAGESEGPLHASTQRSTAQAHGLTCAASFNPKPTNLLTMVHHVAYYHYYYYIAIQLEHAYALPLLPLPPLNKHHRLSREPFANPHHRTQKSRRSDIPQSSFRNIRAAMQRYH
jgi:hypothetical protein